jgi:hypothetical protein
MMHAAALEQQEHLLLLLRGRVKVRVQELSPETATKCIEGFSYVTLAA